LNNQSQRLLINSKRKKDLRGRMLTATF